MPLTSGTYTLGPENGKMTVRTYREGLGSKVGHDLVLAVNRWSGTATINTESPSASSVTLTADARSIDIVEGSGGMKALSDKDRKDILENIEKKVLHTDKHPEITFTSTKVEGDANRGTIDGQLTIAGTTRPITIGLSGEDVPEGFRVKETIPIKQSDWGIKPYTAFLGALKVRDTVELDIEATLTPQ